jgi:hypothetical protein
MQQDYLVKLMMTQLKETSNMRENSSEFLRKIISIYTLHLLRVGNIPTHFFDEVMHDIEAEVVEIYRKKTYGHLTLEEFRRHNFKTKRDS